MIVTLRLRPLFWASIGLALASCVANASSSEDDVTSQAALHAPPDPADRPGGTGACDRYMASLFGGPDAIVAGSGFEPTGFQGNLASLNGLDRSAGGPLPNQWGHLWGYAMHLYGSPLGQQRTDLYVPDGFTKHTAPSGDDAVALFYYPTLGAETNVTLAVYHLASYGIQTSTRNAAGSVRVGQNAGPTGDDPGYMHSHLEVHRGWGLPSFEERNKTRLFFHDVFCPPGVPVPQVSGGPPPSTLPPVPAQWTCSASWYDETAAGVSGAFCDCACGAPDPDCSQPGLQTMGCSAGQTCDATGACAGP